MGRKGWRGSPPADDNDARSRIVAAATRSIERRGLQNTTLSEIAGDLGVSRPTIYRYFPSIDELLDDVLAPPPVRADEEVVVDKVSAAEYLAPEAESAAPKT